ncbi:MAG: hypothetical protein ACP5Q4_04465 [Candidatus Caldatribacteriaceae bacterium]
MLWQTTEQRNKPRRGQTTSGGEKYDRRRDIPPSLVATDTRDFREMVGYEGKDRFWVSHLWENGLSGRIGGEEFAVLFPAVDRENSPNGFGKVPFPWNALCYGVEGKGGLGPGKQVLECARDLERL